MPDNRDRDQTVAQWLRQMPVGAARADDCLDAETLAAWSEGLLDGSERSSAEAHAANCARCQAMLAIMVRTTPVAAASSGSPIRKWLMMLGPAMAAAAAVALWLAVDQGQRSTPSLVDRLAKEQTKAERAPESSAPSSPAPAEREPDRKTPGASLDREAPKESAAPKMVADAQEREERGAKPVDEGTTAARVNEKKDLAAARRVDTPLGSDRRSAAAPPPAAAPAPPPPPAKPASAAEAVQVAAGTPPVAAPPPGPAPPQQANQLQNQNQAQSQTQAQNQALPRQQAAEPQSEPVIVARQPLTRAAGDSASSARARAEGGAFRANPDTFDVVALSSSVRWRVVDGRTVQRSLDAGTSWANQYTAENDMTLVAGSAPSASVCWLVGRGGAMAVTTDGLVWRRLKFPESVDLTAVTSSDARNATVTTADGRRFGTVDGGRTWTRR